MSKTIIFYFIVTSIISQTYSSNRIIGGSEVDIKTCPWQISMFKEGDLHCGGAIISELWIVTAAHCCLDRKKDKYKIRVGSSKRFEDGEVYEIQSSIIHPKYVESKQECDIALILLKVPLTMGPTVQAVSLPPQNRASPDGEKLFLSGFGRVTNTAHSDNLMGIEVFILDWKTCKKRIKKITSTRLCVKAEGKGQ